MIHYIVKTKRGMRIVKNNPIHQIENILFAGSKDKCLTFKLSK